MLSRRDVVVMGPGPGGIQALCERPTGFLQCFDTVGLVIWPVKIVPEMTYNVLSGMLRLYTTTTRRLLEASPLAPTRAPFLVCLLSWYP